MILTCIIKQCRNSNAYSCAVLEKEMFSSRSFTVSSSTNISSVFCLGPHNKDICYTYEYQGQAYCVTFVINRRQAAIKIFPSKDLNILCIIYTLMLEYSHKVLDSYVIYLHIHFTFWSWPLLRRHWLIGQSFPLQSGYLLLLQRATLCGFNRLNTEGWVIKMHEILNVQLTHDELVFKAHVMQLLATARESVSTGG